MYNSRVRLSFTSARMGLWARRLSFCHLGQLPRIDCWRTPSAVRYVSQLAISPAAVNESAGLRHEEACATTAAPPPMQGTTQAPAAQESVWDLGAMLFSIKDHHTRIVSHIEPSRRIRDIRLLDDWMVDKLFSSTGWMQRVKDRGETAPQFRRLIREHQVVRYMLHRFITDAALWRDEVSELMQLLTGRYFFFSELLALVSSKIAEVEMNFYSDSLQDVLRRFVREGGTEKFFSDPAVLWCSFVVSNRNMLSLPSPQRPPFSVYERRPMLSVLDFDELPQSSLPPASLTNEDGRNVHLIKEKTETIDAGGEITLYIPNDCDAPDDVPPLMKVETEKTQYHLNLGRDALYMRLVDPVASSVIKDPPLDPLNVETEDLQLACLWESFRRTKAEDIIDNHRSVCACLEELQTTVLHEMMVRKALLLFFFARDEVRALTEPAVTYQRLRHLHSELRALSLMCAATPQDAMHLASDTGPHTFEKLSIASQLSFTCFGQSHAPVQRWLYRLSMPETSPEGLYSSYVKLYSPDAPMTLNDGKAFYEESTETVNHLASKFPRFDKLNKLQQLAFRFPFENSSVLHPKRTEPIGKKKEEKEEWEETASNPTYMAEKNTRKLRVSASHRRKRRALDQTKNAPVMMTATQLQVDEALATTTNTTTPSPRRRGRARKEIPVTNVPEADTSTRATTISRRGRPPKKATHAPSGLSEKFALKAPRRNADAKKGQTHKDKIAQGALLKDSQKHLTQNKKSTTRAPRHSRKAEKCKTNEGSLSETPTTARRRGRPIKHRSLVF